MILPGFPVLLGVSSGLVLPEITVNFADVPGGLYGYVRPGGYWAGIFGSSYGSITEEPASPYILDMVISVSGDLYFHMQGDLESTLAPIIGFSFNGTPYAFAAPWDYRDDRGLTQAYTYYVPGSGSTGNKTIQFLTS